MSFASLISTMPFFGPGTAPLTSSRFRSAIDLVDDEARAA